MKASGMAGTKIGDPQKGDPMKKHLLRLSIIAALTATVSFAETYNFNVPFNFVLQNQTVAAGPYILDSSAVSGAMVIRSGNHKMSAVVTGASMSSASHENIGKLVFHRYGNRYFLVQIWSRGGSGCELLQTPEERELRAQGKIHQTETTIALR
jgi:hypothetical protein